MPRRRAGPEKHHSIATGPDGFFEFGGDDCQRGIVAKIRAELHRDIATGKPLPDLFQNRPGLADWGAEKFRHHDGRIRNKTGRDPGFSQMRERLPVANADGIGIFQLGQHFGTQSWIATVQSHPADTGINQADLWRKQLAWHAIGR